MENSIEKDFLNEYGLTADYNKFNNEIDFSKYSINELISFGFGNFDGNLLLVPEKLFRYVKSGSELISIGGTKKVVGVDYIDLDTRFEYILYNSNTSCLAYGISKSQLRDSKINSVLE